MSFDGWETDWCFVDGLREEACPDREEAYVLSLLPRRVLWGLGWIRSSCYACAGLRVEALGNHRAGTDGWMEAPDVKRKHQKGIGS